jgi:hypothetical protein
MRYPIAVEGTVLSAELTYGLAEALAAGAGG